MSERLRQIYLPQGENMGAGPRECRARAAKLDAADKATRVQNVGRMSDPALDAIERIRLWESIHRVPLPRRSDHALIGVIAVRTGLTVERVVAEQRRRFGS
jgi:hypothetical protein